MSYQHIPNLYREQEILLFKECYALEKIHGTSAHIGWSKHQPINESDIAVSQISFFSGGANHDSFVALFNIEELKDKIDEINPPSPCYVYGEAYGGKEQGMGKVYGKNLKFIAFEVRMGDSWLSVPQAESFAKSLGLEFVHYRLIPVTIEALDAERDLPSEQARRNGMGDHLREGIVLRPIIELTKNNGDRIIAKHKAEAFKETTTSRPLDASKLQVLSDAKAIADEWVTRERLNHILSRGVVEVNIASTGKIIELMMEDILREASGEIIDSPEARRQIGRAVALLFKEHLKGLLRGD